MAEKDTVRKDHVIGKSVKRVDAFEKVTGRAKYTDDLCDRNAYVAKVLHSTIAHGYVKSVDTSGAEKIPGVVKIVTCFDVPEYYFPTEEGTEARFGERLTAIKKWKKEAQKKPKGEKDE